MGSFYGTCSITQMTLTNQRTCFQLLIPISYSYISKDRGQGKGLQVSNDGALCNYLPFGFPIRGSYYDYGEIDDLDKDKNVEKLEEFFNLPIEDIMTACSRDGWEDEITSKNEIKNREILETLNSTMIREEIYDMLCEGWKNLPTEETKNIKSYSIESYFLEFYKNKKDAEKYSDLYIAHQVCEKVVNKKPKDLTKDDYTIIYSSADFHLKKIRLCGGLFGSNTASYLRTYNNKDHICLLDYNLKDFIDDMKKQYMFIHNISNGLNFVLMPSIYGRQEVNWEQLIKLNKHTERLLQADLVEYNEDMDPEELPYGIPQEEVRNHEIINTLASEESKKLVDDKLEKLYKEKHLLYFDRRELRNLLLEIKDNI